MIETEGRLAEQATFRELLLGENACDIACVLEGTFQDAGDALYLVAPDGKMFRVVSDIAHAADSTGPVLAHCRRIGMYVVEVERFEAKPPMPAPQRQFLPECTAVSVGTILKTVPKALTTCVDGLVAVLFRLRAASALIKPAIEKPAWKPGGSGRDHQSA